MKNKKFEVKVKVEHDEYVYLSVTHNGYQWNSISIENQQEEIPLIISALRNHLISVAPDRAKPSDHKTASEIPLIEAHNKAREQKRP